MPRDHGRILCAIWRDKDFRALSVEAQRLYMLLLSQPNVNNAGVLPLQVSKWAKGCDGTKASDIEAALEELASQNYVFYDDDTEEALVRSYMRNDGVMAHKYIWKNALKCCEAVESPILREVLAAELTRTRRADAVETAAKLIGSDPDPDPGGMPFDSVSDAVETALECHSDGTPHSDGISITTGKGKGKGKVSPSLPTQVGERPTRPHCPDHEENSTDKCGPCARRRRWDEKYGPEIEADELERQRRKRMALADAQRDCIHCDDDGWILGEDGTPAEPAMKCQIHLGAVNE